MSDLYSLSTASLGKPANLRAVVVTVREMGSTAQARVAVGKAGSMADIVAQLIGDDDLRRLGVAAILDGDGDILFDTTRPGVTIVDVQAEMRRGMARRVFSGTGGYVKRTANGAFGVDAIKQGGEEIGGLLRQITRRRAVRQEDFETAMRRLGLTERDLADKQAELRRNTLLYAGAGILFLALSIKVGFQSWTYLVPGVLISLCVLLAAGRQSFRHYQVRRRRLGGLSDWLSHPCEWLPR